MNKFKDLTPKQVALGVICVVVLIGTCLVLLVYSTQPKDVTIKSPHILEEMPVVVDPVAEKIPAVVRAVAEQIPEPEPEPVVDEYVEPEPESQPQIINSGSFKSAGVWYDNNYRYTWYSSNVLYHYRTPEWTAGADGIYRDSDGYVVVASSDLPQGAVIDGTPFGACKVYDSGCASGTLDVYTNF